MEIGKSSILLIIVFGCVCGNVRVWVRECVLLACNSQRKQSYDKVWIQMRNSRRSFHTISKRRGPQIQRVKWVSSIWTSSRHWRCIMLLVYGGWCIKCAITYSSHSNVAIVDRARCDHVRPSSSCIRSFSFLRYPYKFNIRYLCFRFARNLLKITENGKDWFLYYLIYKKIYTYISI